MNIVNRFPGIPQLRCLPVSGGRSASPYRYALNIPGCRAEVNHRFVEWAVGEANKIPGGNHG
jgi:hypothetical protein